jgi:hypothetical protein
MMAGVFASLAMVASAKMFLISFLVANHGISEK